MSNETTKPHEPVETYTLRVVDGTPAQGGSPWVLELEILPGVTDDNVLVTDNLGVSMPPIIEALRSTAGECLYSEGDVITVRAYDQHDVVAYEHSFAVIK